MRAGGRHAKYAGPIRRWSVWTCVSCWGARQFSAASLLVSGGYGSRRATTTSQRVARSAVHSVPAPPRDSAVGEAHVLAFCTEYRQETAILQRSATRNGFAFHAVGVGEPWRGFATKFLGYLRALQDLLSRDVKPQDQVILMDGWDTVILSDVEELQKKTQNLPHGHILCGAERVCGPNHFLVGQMEQLYPDGRTPWRYPNSGGLVSSAASMEALLEGLVHDTDTGTPLDASDNDQVRLHEFLLSRLQAGQRFPLVLDTGCDVFQCMYEEQPQWDAILDGEKPRIRNRMTQSLPIIAHGNGHTGRWFLSALYDDLQLLDYLGLSMGELAHLKHEMPVPPGTPVSEEIKAEYCPWWYTPGLHRGATDGFETFRMIRKMQCGD